MYCTVYIYSTIFSFVIAGKGYKLKEKTYPNSLKYYLKSEIVVLKYQAGSVNIG
jgi:hypothetical protein